MKGRLGECIKINREKPPNKKVAEVATFLF